MANKVDNGRLVRTKGKVKLDFMIDPTELVARCYVPNPVRIKIVKPKSIFLEGVLGESGRRMIRGGCIFIFTKSLAEELIKNKVAVRA